MYTRTFKKLFLVAIAFLFLENLYTQNPASVTLGINFASTNFHRGIDYNRDTNSTENKIFNFSPVAQPEITFFTPLRGFYFDLFASFTLKNREKENLKRNDQIDFAAIYDFSNRVGSWLVSYTLHANLYDGSNFGEFEFSYQFPFEVVNLTLTQFAAHSFQKAPGFLYSKISLAKTFLGFFSPSLIFGYQYHPYHEKRIAHLDLNLPFCFRFATKKQGNIELKLSSAISYQIPSRKEKRPPLWQIFLETAVFYNI